MNDEELQDLIRECEVGAHCFQKAKIRLQMALIAAREKNIFRAEHELTEAAEFMVAIVEVLAPGQVGDKLRKARSV